VGGRDAETMEEEDKVGEEVRDGEPVRCTGFLATGVLSWMLSCLRIQLIGASSDCVSWVVARLLADCGCRERFGRGFG